MKTIIRTIESCKNCPIKPIETVKVKSHICKYKGEWDKYHRGGEYSLTKCTHPVIGGKECSIKFNEHFCDYDTCYECPCDEFGWCDFKKSKSLEVSLLEGISIII